MVSATKEAVRLPPLSVYIIQATFEQVLADLQTNFDKIMNGRAVPADITCIALR